MNEQLEPVSIEEQTIVDQRAAMQEGEIVSGLCRGEMAAWTALYDLYGHSIWRYVARLVGPGASDVADIVQETLLAAAQSARNYDETKGRLWPWLAGIAHHRISAYWREEQQTIRLRHALAQQGTMATADGAVASGWELFRESTQSPGRRLERQELADIVRATLAQLPPDYAAILTAKYIDELSLIEIQQQTGSTSDALRSKMVRARQLFRETYIKLSDPVSPHT